MSDIQSTEPFSYSVALTSCGRFDLLRTTVESFLQHADIMPDSFIITEDSGDPAVHDALKGLDAPFNIIINETQLGMMGAIDTAYAAVKTPYVFHCEDDWEFFRTGFVEESRRVLDNVPEAIMVGLRPRDELNTLVKDLPGTQAGGVDYFAFDPSLHPEYFSYSTNPGLRRLEDYQRLAPLERLGYEPDVSYAYKKLGFRMVNLEQPAVKHIGWGRHVHDPTQPKKAKTPWAKLKRSIRKRVKRWQRSANED